MTLTRDKAPTHAKAPPPLVTVGSSDRASSAYDVESATKFWGHLGLRLVGSAKSKWYPVSSEEADRIRSDLKRSHDVSEWLVVETMNNHTLVFRPKQLQRIWLLDDMCDAPEADFGGEGPWGDRVDIPEEVYVAMADWADGHCSGKGGPKSAYSRAIQKVAVSAIEQAGLKNRPDLVRSALRHTAVHFTDGSSTQYEVDPENLLALADLDVAPNAQVVEISASGGDFESFYPASALTMIDIPTIELNAVQMEMWGKAYPSA